MLFQKLIFDIKYVFNNNFLQMALDTHDTDMFLIDKMKFNEFKI
jgi:hypothetical protein